jgi:serine/threonine-protein kinase
MSVLAKEIEATYEVLSKMGEGGMGAVYKVRHRFFDEIRVIKVMQTRLEGSAELNERFLGEAKRGKQLRHPNLAEVIDFSIAADGTAYIVMEYIEGVNLRELLLRTAGPLDYKVVVPIAEQALDALGFLHSKRFVHRDISPDNIMLTAADDGETRVKLIDLGIAKSLESTRQLTMAGKFIGKVQYASPEQFSGEVDQRSDIYAFGVLLYELLTGSKPIKGEDYFSIITGHLSKPPRPFTDTDPGHRVPTALRQAVMKALEKKPEDRFQTAKEFADALRACIAPEERRTIAATLDKTMPDVEVPRFLGSSVPRVDQATAPEEVRGTGEELRGTVPAPRPTPSQKLAQAPTVVSAETPVAPSRKWMGIAAVVALLLLAGAVALWLRPGDVKPVPVPEPVASDTITTPGTVVDVPAVESGMLIVNAFPWGQVTSVRDASGTERLTATAETPYALSLPAGAYKVALTNPNSKKSVVLDATVTANATSRCEAELDQVDAAQYVDRIGIGE